MSNIGIFFIAVAAMVCVTAISVAVVRWQELQSTVETACIAAGGTVISGRGICVGKNHELQK